MADIETTEVEDATTPQELNLLKLSVEEVEDYWNKKLITDDQAQTYIAYKDMEQNGLRHVSPENAERLHKIGAINDDQAESYIAFQNHPYWWTMKDYGKGILRGVSKFVNTVGGFAQEVTNPALMLKEYAPESLKKYLPGEKYEIPLVDAPESGVGKGLEVISEFVVPFGIASKAVKGAKAAEAIISKLPKAIQSAPKVAEFLKFTIEGTLPVGLPT